MIRPNGKARNDDAKRMRTRHTCGIACGKDPIGAARKTASHVETCGGGVAAEGLSGEGQTSANFCGPWGTFAPDTVMRYVRPASGLSIKTCAVDRWRRVRVGDAMRTTQTNKQTNKQTSKQRSQG